MTSNPLVPAFYPDVLDSHEWLVAERTEVSQALVTPIDADDTEIELADVGAYYQVAPADHMVAPAGFPPLDYPYIDFVEFPDGEVCTYSGVDLVNNLLTGVVRGALAIDGYPAAAPHDAGEMVTQYQVPEGTRDHVSQMVVIEQKLGLGRGPVMPVGGAILYPNVPPPEGWFKADGQAISRSNTRLFAAYGTTYGAGDGTTTFNLPHLHTKIEGLCFIVKA